MQITMAAKVEKVWFAKAEGIVEAEAEELGKV